MFAEGVDCEVFSFAALEKAHREADLNSEREHVTLFIHRHPEFFQKITLENSADHSKYRFTIDEAEDLKVVERILAALYRRDQRPFTMEEIIAFLDAHPEIHQLNSHVVRNAGLMKSLKEDHNFGSTC